MKFIRKNLHIILIFLVTIILLIPLFINVRYYGHDTIFHTSNIINLSKTISWNNILGDNIIKTNVNKFGYGIWLFYPKLPHLLGSYCYFITKNVYTSMNIIYFLITFLSGIVMFYLSLKVFNNRKVALLSSVIYLTFPYHICEIYVRDAFAENFMFLAVPLIFLGLYYLKDNCYNKFYLCFILGYLIGMYSHLVSMIFCTIFVFIFIMYYNKIFLTNKKIKALIISTLIVTAISLPYLTSILEHKLLGDYIVFGDSFSTIESTIYNTINFESFYNQIPIYNNIMTYLNIVVIVLLVLTTIIFLLKRENLKYYKERLLLVFAILFIMTLISSKYVWNDIFSSLTIIQFPWRLLLFLDLVVSLYVSSLFLENCKYKIFLNIFYILVFYVIILSGVNNITYYGNKQYSTDYVVNSMGSLGWQMEYLPSNAIEDIEYSLGYQPIFYFQERAENIILSNDKNVKITLNEEKYPNLSFQVENIDEDAIIELPRIYYLGYKLIDQDSNNIMLYNNKNGFIESKLDNNGKYKLMYVGTIYDKIARIICYITIIWLVIVGLIKCWRYKYD